MFASIESIKHFTKKNVIQLGNFTYLMHRMSGCIRRWTWRFINQHWMSSSYIIANYAGNNINKLLIYCILEENVVVKKIINLKIYPSHFGYNLFQIHFLPYNKDAQLSFLFLPAPNLSSISYYLEVQPF